MAGLGKKPPILNVVRDDVARDAMNNPTKEPNMDKTRKEAKAWPMTTTVALDGPPYWAEDGTRLTDCCQAMSTYCDDALSCKKCFAEVPIGQGDGSTTKKRETNTERSP